MRYLEWKKWLVTGLLVAAIFGTGKVVIAAMTNSVGQRPTAHWWTGNPRKDVGWAWAKEVETYMEGTAGVQWFYIAPRSAVPTTAAEGVIYYDSDDDNIYVYANGGWVDLTAGASGVSDLDSAYNGGNTIDVDGSALTFTVSDTDNNAVMVLVQNDSTNDPTAVQITSAADAANAISLDIDGQTTGRDIEGTGASFYVEGDGSIVATDLTITGVYGIVLAQGATIDNVINGAIRFKEGGEDISMVMSADTITYSSTTAVDQFAFGALDNLTGIDDIAFDATTTSGITKASSEAAADFTLSMSGAVDSSLILSSTGTAADALQFITTAGGIDITSSGTVENEDIDITTDASVNVTATGDYAQAVLITENGGTSSTIDIYSDAGTGDDSIDIESQNGGIDVDAAKSIVVTSSENTADSVQIASSAGGIDVTAAGAADEDLDLVCTLGSTNISGGEAIANAVTIAAPAGGVDISSAATFDIDVTATGGTVQVIASEAAANQFKVDAQGTVAGNAIVLETTSGGVQVLADGAGTGDITLDAEGLVSIVSAEAAANQFKVDAQGTVAGNAIVLETTSGGVQILADGAGTGDITLDAEGLVSVVSAEAAADQFKVDAQGTVAGNAINFETTDGGILLNADGAANGDIGLNAEDDITITAAGDLTLAVTGTLTTGELSVFTRKITTDIDDRTLTAAESGQIFDNSADADTTVFTLPTAAAGLQFTFIDVEAAAAADLCILAAAGDKIQMGTAAEYYNCYDDTAGSSVTLVAIDATEWYVIAEKGTWTADSDTTAP